MPGSQKDSEPGSQKDSEHTALHMASYYGQVKVVKYLLKSGAQVDAVSRRGRTPLHDASKRGHSQVLELLVEAGADIAAQSPWFLKFWSFDKIVNEEYTGFII